MHFVVMDVGCADCGESSNFVGIFTSLEKARTALKEYISVNKLENNVEHEFYIYKIDQLDRIYHGFDHLIEEFSYKK